MPAERKKFRGSGPTLPGGSGRGVEGGAARKRGAALDEPIAVLRETIVTQRNAGVSFEMLAAQLGLPVARVRAIFEQQESKS